MNEQLTENVKEFNVLRKIYSINMLQNLYEYERYIQKLIKLKNLGVKIKENTVVP